MTEREQVDTCTVCDGPIFADEEYVVDSFPLWDESHAITAAFHVSCPVNEE